jgi:pimeloyl-ACP methyl ester carboxylesterase
MRFADAGLANDYWKQYYTPEEVQEALRSTVTTTIPSGEFPVHVRIWPQPHPAPVVLMGSSILSYGLHLLRIQAPFFRAGFNVMQFDFPGLGQSGGPRGGCTVSDFIRCWKDALNFAHLRFGEPLYGMGVGEDGVTLYYAAANRPGVAAISVHNLFEYGEPDAVQGQGPYWLVRAKAGALAAAAALRPSTTMPGSKAVPWEWIFAGPGDAARIETLYKDPLALRQVQLRMVSSILQKRPPPVPFEQCRTPVQVIASDRNKVCPYSLVTRNYERLGGSKELVTLPGKPQWELNREFQEDYCELVIRWFRQNGADVQAPAARDAVTA